MPYLDETVKNMMEEYKRCLSNSMIGGYTLIYFDSSDNIFCGGCATKIAEEITTVRTYDEGADLECSECSCTIPSSYGDPEE